MNQAKHAVNIIRVGDEWIHYHARHNFSFPASQLVCLPAYQPACLITCPHTEHLLSRLKGHGRRGAEVEYYFFSQEFIFKRRSVEFLYSVCLKTSLPPSPANCPASFYYSLWQAAFLSTCPLKYPSYLCESVHSSKPPNPFLLDIFINASFKPSFYPECFCPPKKFICLKENALESTYWYFKCIYIVPLKPKNNERCTFTCWDICLLSFLPTVRWGDTTLMSLQ